MDIDRALEHALQADDPGPAFAGRVVAAIRAGQAPSSANGAASASPAGQSWKWRALLPLAATVALTMAGLEWRTAPVEDAAVASVPGEREQAGAAEDARARAAHAQLVQALRLTGETLNVVHRAIERSQE